MNKLLLVVLLFTGISLASAQDVYTSSGKPGYHKKVNKHKKGYDPDKLIIGGGLTADFGGGYANVGVSPMVGYRLTKNFSAGVGIGYLYSQMPAVVDQSTGEVFYARENIIYPSLWTRYFVFRNFFVSGTYEYDIINARQPGFDQYGNFTRISFNGTNSCLFLGAGFRIPVGGRVSLLIEGLYDVIQGKNSPYAPGFPTTFRMGFAAGL